MFSLYSPLHVASPTVLYPVVEFGENFMEIGSCPKRNGLCLSVRPPRRSLIVTAKVKHAETQTRKKQVLIPGASRASFHFAGGQGRRKCSASWDGELRNYLVDVFAHPANFLDQLSDGSAKSIDLPGGIRARSG